MRIILNEKSFAEECIENKTLGEKPYYTLGVLAKYYYKYHNLRKVKIIKTLTAFIENYYPPYHYSKAMWDESIERIAKHAGKYPLYEIDGVWVTDKELAKIDELPNKVLRRLAFTLLCLAKLNHIRTYSNHGWVNQDAKIIFELARIDCPKIERYRKLGELRQLGYLELPKANDNLSVRVTYMDEDAKDGLFISDFRELGYEYMKLKGVNLIRCAECGVLTRGNKNGTRKYCKNCATYKPKDYKTVTCIDCGKTFNVLGNNRRTKRCSDCQNSANKEKKRVWKQQNNS